MANVKISNLPAATGVTGDDLLPVVDGGTTTQKATFQQVLDYVTGSTFGELNVTTLSASVLYVSASVIETSGSTKFGDTIDDTHQFTGSVYGTQTISGSTVEATSITGSIISASNFYGDGSGITGVTAEWDGSHVGNAEITGTLSIVKTAGPSNWALELSNGATYPDPGLKIRTQAAAPGAGGNDSYIWSTRTSSSISSDVYLGLKSEEDTQPSMTMWVSGNVPNGAHSGPEQSGYLYLKPNELRHSHYLIDTPTALWTRSQATNTYVGLGMTGSDGCSVTAGKSGTGDAQLIFQTSNSSSGEAERMRIDVSGNVGIGTSSPAAKLDVSGSLIADVALSGAVGSEITSTSYSLSSADRGKTLLFSSSATQGITCSSGLDVGYNTTFIQLGSGQLELSASAGASILNRQSHTKSAGLYAAASVVIISANTYLFAGDTEA